MKMRVRMNSYFCKTSEMIETKKRVKAVSNASRRDSVLIRKHSEFSNNKNQCHGRYNCMRNSSSRVPLAFLLKKLCKLRNIPIHIVRHIKNKGVAGMMKLVFLRVLSSVGIREKFQPITVPAQDEVLNLQVGDLIEVKSYLEITKTLDENQRYKGLYFMGEMRQFCGKQFRVFKRVNRILLESTGEIRTVKNTVLLEGVVCDGHIWYDCDRSCFYYWREAWLKKMDFEPNNGD